MAAAASATVDCPACGAELEVPIALSSSADGGRLVLRVEPDRAKVAEHVRLRHGSD